MLPKIFIGPMSKNIVDTIIEYSNINNTPIGIIPSRRQIEFNGGYVNNWTTKEFCSYIKEKTKNVLLVRDHCGPLQGYLEDDGIESFDEDCKYFDVIHIDVWKKYKNYEDGLNATIDLINRGYSNNTNLIYEVATEEAIRPFSTEEINNLLTDLKNRLNPEIFEKIKYCVIQSGTALKGNKNIGKYNNQKLKDMVSIVNKHSLISKEHNGDYLTNELLYDKFLNGLDSINVAPEFGQIETNVILNEILESYNQELFDKFYQICFDSKRWVKWVDNDFKPEENKKEIINICGHYVFSNPDFLKIKEKLSKDIDLKIKNKLYLRIEEMISNTKMNHIDILNNYFDFFSKKDLNSLSKLFSENITLSDWEINAIGKENVLNANLNIFNSVDTINAKPINYFTNKENNSYSIELIIIINDFETINVIDIINFNDKNEITSITAYKK